jgi:hypothetical protein
MATLEDLIADGFKPITRWELRGQRIKPASLAWDDSAGWLYAFSVARSVRYIGLTAGVLRTRLDNYSYGKDPYTQGSQCERIREAILAELVAGKEVQIHGRTEPEMAKRNGEEARLRAAFWKAGLWNRV